ncbi:MAG TPA: hypothetical protein DD671_13430, partial [Balneolaceae bacterium]|nr:hypothetical protein [Balneolaceae bacterium]
MGLAAVLARALVDKILDDLDKIGFLYVHEMIDFTASKDVSFENGGISTAIGRYSRAIAFQVFPEKQEYRIVTAARSKGAIPRNTDMKYSKIFFHQALAANMFQEYGGDFIVLGNSYYVDFGVRAEKAAAQLFFNKAKIFKERSDTLTKIGEDFLSRYVKSEDNIAKILDVFESKAAVGYFAAEFIVVITQAQAEGSLGHVQTQSAASAGRQLVIKNNAMTVTVPTSAIWNMGYSFLSAEQVDYVKKTMELPVGNKLIKVRPKKSGNMLASAMVSFDNSIRRIVASNTTYIHELQHLIQHTAYQTPTSGLDPKAAKNAPLTSPQNPLHPYNDTKMTNTDTARLAGLAKSKRPPKQHVKIVSDLLREMNIIKGSEIKLKGVNSPAFEVNESYFNSARANLQTSPKTDPYIILNLEEGSGGQNSLAEIVVKYMSDTYLSGLPGSKNPDEREEQLKRFGSAKGKKSVARKYRLFIADILADMGIAIAQNSPDFDYTDQIKADMGVGPRDITVPAGLDKLKKIASAGDPKQAAAAASAIKRLNQSLVNKGGKLSQKLIGQVAELFPLMVFYSRKLEI